MESTHATDGVCIPFVYKSRFKGNYKELTELFGVDIYEDIETWSVFQRYLDKNENNMRFLNEASSQAIQGIHNKIIQVKEDLEHNLSDHQKEYRKICESMHFKGNSGRPGFGNGAFFALVPKVANEIEDVFSASELSKGAVVFSPEYGELVSNLLKKARRRQNREECVHGGEPHNLATFSHFEAECQRVVLRRGFYDPEPSLSRVTHSTGYSPYDAEGKSWGKGSYKKCNPRKHVATSRDAHEGDHDSTTCAGTGSNLEDQTQGGDTKHSESNSGPDENVEDIEKEESVVAESVGTLLTSANELIEETDMPMGMAFMPQLDKLPLCKNGPTFAEHMAKLIVRLVDAVKLYLNPELVASFTAKCASQALSQILDQAKAWFASDVLKKHFARSYQSPVASANRSMNGYARAVKESYQRVAERVSCDAVKLIDLHEIQLRKHATKASRQQDGPFALADWLCQQIPPFIDQVLTGIDIQKIAIQSWNEQENMHRASKKALKGGSKKISDNDGCTLTNRPEKLKTISEVVAKEHARLENKYDKERKGGRMKPITGASRTSNNRRRDYVLPF